MHLFPSLANAGKLQLCVALSDRLDFSWARGGQLYARARFIVNLGVSFFFFFFFPPLQTASENAWLPDLDVLWCRSILQTVWERKFLRPSYGPNLTLSLAVVLINQSWLGFSQWAQQHEHSECRGLLVSMLVPVGWLTWNILPSPETTAAPLHAHLQPGGWGRWGRKER